MSDTTTNLTDPKPVTLDLAHLPDDPAFLKQLVIDLVSQLQQEKTEKEHLHHRLAQILRHRFGRRAETLDPHQMELFLQQVKDRLQQIPPPPPEPPLTPVPPPGHGRRKPPMNLPRRRVEYPLPAEKRFCAICGKPLVKIGEEVRHVYEYVPASIVVVEQVKEKWACEPCQGNVVESELPPIPIEKGMPGPGLLAHVITSKYADHLPLYRQESILARHGLSLTRSTMCDWIGRSSDLLSPLYAEMTKDLLGSHKLNTDDTPVPVLDDRKPKGEDPTSIITSGEAETKADEGPARRKTREGRLWVYVGDDSHPHIVFDYSPDRRQEHPQRFLAGWHGSLQADAYTGYDAMYKLEDIIEVACWAHARRYFYDAKGTDPPRALMALAYIRKLYEVEWAAKGMSPPERKALRQERAKPILDVFKTWLDAQAYLVLPKSPMREAIGYALGQWAALNQYVEDGALDIDNNVAERALRCVAIGRKNWLFAGSDAGGRRAAILYSLIASCKRHKIDPFAYLRDVIERICTLPQSRIRELLPAYWKPAPSPLEGTAPQS